MLFSKTTTHFSRSDGLSLDYGSETDWSNSKFSEAICGSSQQNTTWCFLSIFRKKWQVILPYFVLIMKVENKLGTSDISLPNMDFKVQKALIVEGFLRPAVWFHVSTHSYYTYVTDMSDFICQLAFVKVSCHTEEKYWHARTFFTINLLRQFDKLVRVLT